MLRALGFELNYGGEQADFTSFSVGSGYLNLVAASPELLSFSEIAHLAIAVKPERTVATASAQTAQPANRQREGALERTESIPQEGRADTFRNPLNGRFELLNDRPPLVLRAGATGARVIAVEKPMQYSVPWTSLSIVLGMAMTGTDWSSRTFE